MAYFNNDVESPSTGYASINFDTNNPENDRLRLGRELARDFQSPSFSPSSSRSSGRHQNKKNNNKSGNTNDDGNDDDDSVTLDSFDISNDAAGMSTRRSDMLQQTPTIDTQLLDQFPDFSMAGRDLTEDSIEIGRGDTRATVDDSLRSVDFSSQQPFSIGGSTRKPDRGLFSNPNAGRKSSLSSAHSDPSELFQASSRRIAVANNKGKEKARAGLAPSPQRLGSITNFDLSQIEISTPRNRRGRTGLGGNQGGTKITDFVSNSGSGGSRSRFADIQRSLEFDDESASENGSIYVRPRGPVGSRFGGSPRPRQTATANALIGGKRVSRIPETKNNDLTDDLPAIVAKTRKQPSAKIPLNFKSTDTFLHELGLDGNTTTMDLKTRLNHLKDIDTSKGDNTAIGITQQSYLLPQISDLSELISGYPGDATRMSHKRGPFNNTKDHKPIESIPVPHDERAVLMAMRLLQDKVANLEGSKAEAEHRCMKLEGELRRSETRVRLEQQKVKVAEETLTRKQSGDSTFGGSDDGDSQERVKEKQKLELQMNMLKLESTINSLHAQLDKLTRDLETTKIALRHMQEERNSAVNSVALAIANNEDLKDSIEELKNEVKRLQAEGYEQEVRGEREREVWKACEERLQRKAKQPNQSALLAQGVMKEAARRDAVTAAAMGAAGKEAARVERQERRAREKEAQKEAQKEQERAAMEEQVRIEKELKEKREQDRVVEQGRKLEKMIEQQLKEIRPDLYKPKSYPGPGDLLTASQNLALGVRPRKQKGRAVVLPKRSRKQVTIEEAGNEPVVRALREELEVSKQKEKNEQVSIDDTAMSISPEEVKRIANEINTERKKRKAAAATANAILEAVAVAAEARSTEQMERPKTKELSPKLVATFPTPIPAVEPSGESSVKAPVPEKAHNAAGVAKVDKGKNSAKHEESTVPPPTILKQTVSFDVAAQTQIHLMPQKKAKRTRLVKKVVFYYDEDTTQTIQLEKEVEEEVSEDENGEDLVDKTIRTPATQEEQSGEEGLTVEFEEGLTQEHIRSVSPAIPDIDPAPEVLPRSPVIEDATLGLPEHVYRVANQLTEHDPKQCTVCARMTKLQVQEREQRMQNPLADIDNSMAIPAPALKPASCRRGPIRIVNGYEEEPTPRPSQGPKRQLSKVVRQLEDEFAHLKLNYQTKVDEFMDLDPTIGKRRRKTLTNEMNELAAEMDYKCDQIYALFDVNEEFVNASDTSDEEDKKQEVEIGRGEPDGEDEYDLTGFTIPEMSMIDESTEADDSEGEKRGRR